MISIKNTTYFLKYIIDFGAVKDAKAIAFVPCIIPSISFFGSLLLLSTSKTTFASKVAQFFSSAKLSCFKATIFFSLAKSFPFHV